MYDANKPYGFINLYVERQPSFNTIFLPEAIYNVLHFGKTLEINILSRHTTRGKFVMFDQGSTFIVIKCISKPYISYFKFCVKREDLGMVVPEVHNTNYSYIILTHSL